MIDVAWNTKQLDLSIHTDVYVCCDGNPFDSDEKRSNWRVCAWEKSIQGEPEGSVVLHRCQNGEEAREIVRKVRKAQGKWFEKSESRKGNEPCIALKLLRTFKQALSTII